MNLDETAQTDWALHAPPQIHKRNNQLVKPLAAALTVMADENSVKLVQLCTRVCSCVPRYVYTHNYFKILNLVRYTAVEVIQLCVHNVH